MQERDLPSIHEAVKFPSGSFVDQMMRLDSIYGLHLEPHIVLMAQAGEAKVHDAKDVSHDWLHYAHIGQDVGLILSQYPSLIDAIDWNAFTAAVAFHDVAVANLEPHPWNLWFAQNKEHTFAAGPAVEYMKQQGFSPDTITRVSHLITTHPLNLDDPMRKRLDAHVDDKLKLTGRLLYIVDALDVFRPSRIDAIVTHISNTFWGMNMTRFYPIIYHYFQRNANFSFDLGPDYPWVAQEAARRREQAGLYINDLLVSRKDVRPSVSAWRSKSNHR